MFASASGELNTRLLPNVRWSPCVALNTPPLPGTRSTMSQSLASATSWPNTTISGLRAISSCSVRLIAETIVIGSPWGEAAR